MYAWQISKHKNVQGTVLFGHKCKWSVVYLIQLQAQKRSLNRNGSNAFRAVVVKLPIWAPMKWRWLIEALWEITRWTSKGLHDQQTQRNCWRWQNREGGLCTLPETWVFHTSTDRLVVQMYIIHGGVKKDVTRDWATNCTCCTNLVEFQTSWLARALPGTKVPCKSQKLEFINQFEYDWYQSPSQILIIKYLVIHSCFP